MLFLLGAEAVGEVTQTAAVFLFAHGGGGIEHHRLPYHFGEDIHLSLASLDVIVYKIGVRQRFLHVWMQRLRVLRKSVSALLR